MGKYINELNNIKGKTIAIVYIFEGETAPGFEHYWVWKSDIISGWLLAIQELQCLPYIMDVRTFIQKASNQTLPKIDYVINLNCGSCELSSMSLVPSMCSFLSIPCIPCNSIAIVMGENKHISNLLAKVKGLNIPDYLSYSDSNGIFRPLNLGSSIGIEIGKCSESNPNGIYQKFIPGYDVTIPIVYNPTISDIDLLPPLVYIPKNMNPHWIYDLHEKYTDNEGFIKIPLADIEASTRETILEFARTFPITTFGRIDARIQCEKETLSNDIANYLLSLDNFYFIEINPMPTIEYGDSFEMSYNTAKSTVSNSFYECIKQYSEYIRNPSMIGFVLSSSIIALTKAISQGQTD